MFRTFLAAAAVSIMTVAAPTVASAATYDFVKLANDYKSANSGQEGSWDQVTGGSLTDGGITVTASATFYGDDAHAFFDGRDGSGDAGLGVCHSGFDGLLSECSSNGGSFPGDDNITSGEILTLSFDTTVELMMLEIRDAGHKLITSLNAININGDVYEAVGGLVDLTGLLASTMFDFSITDQGPQIYLSTMTVAAVPLPLPGVLLLGGLGGLVVLRRKRNVSA